MDDPIIGLTIYDSKLTKNSATTVYRSHKHTPPALPSSAVQQSNQQPVKSSTKKSVGGPVQSRQYWSEDKQVSIFC